MYCEEGKGDLYLQLCLYISCRDDSRVSMTSSAAHSLNSAVCKHSAWGIVLRSACLLLWIQAQNHCLFLYFNPFPPFSWCSYYQVLFGRRSMQKPAAFVHFYNFLPDVKRLLEGWCGSFIMAGAVETTIDERQEDIILAVRAKPEMITLE